MADNRQRQFNPIHRCEFCGKEFVRVKKIRRFCSIAHSKRKHSTQTIEVAKELWTKRVRAPEIAKQLGCSSDAIYGISTRHDFPNRWSRWMDGER